MVAVKKQSEVHQFPRLSDQRAVEVSKNLSEDERSLLREMVDQAGKRGRSDGRLQGAIPGLVVGVAVTLLCTTFLFDPISRAAGQNVATGAAIAAQKP